VAASIDVEVPPQKVNKVRSGYPYLAASDYVEEKKLSDYVDETPRTANMWEPPYYSLGANAFESDADPHDPIVDESAAAPGLIALHMTAPFVQFAGLKPAEIKVQDLQKAFFDTEEAWKEMDLMEAAKNLHKNSVLIMPCGRPDSSVDECLVDEQMKLEAKGRLQDLVTGKPALLDDPSPATGFIWSCRIVGFMGSMFKEAAEGASMEEAGQHAFDERIKPAFSPKRSHLTDMAVMALVKKALTIQLPKGKQEEEYFIRHGYASKEAARAEMEEFASVALPVIDGIYDYMIDLQLDDAKGWKSPPPWRKQ
jgi:hypothetical protein